MSKNAEHFEFSDFFHPKNEMILQIEGDTKLKEQLYEKEIQSLKSEILETKSTLASTTLAHSKELQTLSASYDHKLSQSKNKSSTKTSSKSTTLTELKSVLQSSSRDLNKLIQARLKVISSCNEEILLLKNKITSLNAILEEVDLRIKRLTVEKASSLKKSLSDLKSSRRLEKDQMLSSFKTNQQELDSESRYKTELLSKLELTASELKSELDSIETRNKRKLHEVRRQISLQEEEESNIKLQISKANSYNTAIGASSTTLESQNTTKLTEMEQIKSTNTYLRDRLLKLQKFVFGKLSPVQNP